jgi:microcystin-dependent protein
LFATNGEQDGYLPCDGTVYDISDYPDLGQILGDLWGGDGISTFAVPDFSGGKIIKAGVTGAAATVGQVSGVDGTDDLADLIGLTAQIKI